LEPVGVDIIMISTTSYELLVRLAFVSYFSELEDVLFIAIVCEGFLQYDVRKNLGNQEGLGMDVRH